MFPEFSERGVLPHKREIERSMAFQVVERLSVSSEGGLNMILECFKQAIEVAEKISARDLRAALELLRSLP